MPTDAGLPGRDAGPPPTETEIDVWARLPGITATVEGTSVVLDQAGGSLTIRPPIRAASTQLALTGDTEGVVLGVDWSLDYEEIGAPADTPLEHITLIVYEDADGECALGFTNGLAGGGAFTGTPPSPIPCGPFGLRRFRLEPRDGAFTFVELHGDGLLRYAETATSEVREATVSDDELSEARAALLHASMFGVLDTGCGEGTHTITMDFPLESLAGTDCGGRVVDEARARLDALIATHFP